MMNSEEKAVALANYLGIGVEDVAPEKYDDNAFETPEGEYLVLDEDEIFEYVKTDVENLIDDIGLSAFTSDFQSWIFDYAVSNNDWFDEAMDESNRFYAEDIMGESDNKYASRFIQECVERNILSDEDLVETEDGLDYPEGKSNEDYIEDFVASLNDDYEDGITWFRDNFGDDEFRRAVNEYLNVNTDAIAEKLIDLDGVGNSLASYDGKEIDLGDGLYAYRTN